MTNDAEVGERLAASMRDHVAGMRLAGGEIGDVLARAGRRHRRRKAWQRSAFGAGGVAVAVMAIGWAAVMNATSGDGGVRQTPAVYVEEDTSQARLVAAITASQSTSYHVSVTVDGTYGLPSPKHTTFEGAYDPATNSGWLRSGTIEERLVYGVRYIIFDGHAEEVPKSKFNGLLYEWPVGQEFLGTSTDPQTMLDSMRQRDAKVTETSRGVFHFEMTVPREGGKGETTIGINGDVTVGKDNRVAKVAYQTEVKGVFNFNLATVMEFSDYGAPVKVEKP